MDSEWSRGAEVVIRTFRETYFASMFQNKILNSQFSEKVELFNFSEFFARDVEDKRKARIPLFLKVLYTHIPDNSKGKSIKRKKGEHLVEVLQLHLGHP